jgi:hypothetical protein
MFSQRRKSEMNKSMRSTAIGGLAALAGGVAFGIAMEFRASFGSIWMRAAVAGVGAAVAVGIASAIMLVCRKREE